MRVWGKSDFEYYCRSTLDISVNKLSQSLKQSISYITLISRKACALCSVYTHWLGMGLNSRNSQLPQIKSPNYLMPSSCYLFSERLSSAISSSTSKSSLCPRVKVSYDTKFFPVLRVRKASQKRFSVSLNLFLMKAKSSSFMDPCL